MITMKPNKLNEKVKAKLLEFETLASFNPSPDWDDQLNRKLQSKFPRKNNYANNYQLILACIVVLNIGLVTLLSFRVPEKTAARTARLELLSKELLLTSN